MTRLQGESILVAGGSGLIGTNLTQRLVDQGATVRASYCSREPGRNRELYRRFDFTSFDDCMEASRGVESVVLCASATFGSGMMKLQPTAFLLPNLQMNAGLIEACARNQVKRVVFVSSTTVYQECNRPVRESDLDLNRQPYALYLGVGWLNRYLEQLISSYKVFYGIDVSIIRPTSIYGPHDCFDDAKSHVIPALIRRAIRRETPFIVWGDGSAVRDFVYVGDVVDDIVEALEGGFPDPVNVGSGVPVDVRSAVDVILEACNHRVVPVYDLTKVESIPFRAVDMSVNAATFGSRRRTTFEEGIRKTVAWYFEQFGTG